MKNTTNVFLDGIITDQNPLTMPQTALTSALNATIITGNGNEGLLLNDMGNTLIKDSITGNIMSLSNGFIPLGMKERGGILYIASYNPQTKEGELGTIPSPIIAYTYNENSNTETTNLTISDIKSSDTSDDILVDDRLYKSQIYILSDHVFHGGDKFIVILNLNLEKNTAELYATTYKQIISNSELNPYISEINFPQITNIKNRGWFKIKLLALGINGEDPKELVSITNEAQEYYTTSGKKTSDYWFINSNEIEGVFNLNKTRTSNLFRTFPNIQSGRLAIQFEVEKPEQLEYLYNKQYGKNLPLLIALETETGADYYAAVHGFLYNNGLCAIQPDKIVVNCNCPIYLSKNNNGVYNIDTSEQFTKIEILSKPNPDDLGDINNNSGRIKTDFSGNPVACGFAYLSNILNLDKITTKFIISKYRDSSNIEFENYSNNNDALFFIKLESFDKDIEVSVDLYTKDFTNINSYVKYDSYKLPAFNPLEEEGQNDIDRKTAVQALFINKPLNVKYDFELFNNVDFDNGELACFICENGDDENSYILEYDSKTRKYVETQHKLKDYANLKTWIYPITAHVNANPSNQWLVGHVLNQYHFLWWYNVNPKSNPGDYYDINARNIYINYAKDYLKLNGNDGLPTYKLPCLPEIKIGELVKKVLLPIQYQSDDNAYKMYEAARDAKSRAESFPNELGYTVHDLKKYCLLDNNLMCFDKYIPSGLNTWKGLYLSAWNDDWWGRTLQYYEEDFLQNELHIFDDSDININSTAYLPVNTLFQKIRCDDINNLCTRYSLLHGGLNGGLNESNVRNSLIEGFLRPYLLGSTQIHLGYRYNLRNEQEKLSTTTGAGTPMIGHLASFVTFLAKSTPGYIPCNKDYTLLNLHLFTNNYSLKYLYNSYKNQLSTTFVNKGKSTITLNYLNYPIINNESLQVDDEWMWFGLKYFYVDSAFINIWSHTTLPLNVTYKFSTLVDGLDPIIKSFHTTDYFIDCGLKSNSILGVSTESIRVPISESIKNEYIKTKCNIIANDGFENTEYKDYSSDEDLILTGNDIREMGKNNEWTTLNLRNTIIKHIESTNILTTSRAKLFVDKSLSNLSYTNKSDYSIDYILSLKNNYGIKILNNSIPTQTVSNIDTTNLLANSDIGEVETMNDLKILKGLGTIENSLDICNNSFLNENGYLTQLDQTLIFNPVSVSKGWYVFNINYNYNYNLDSAFETVLYINGSALKSIKASENLHMIAIYIPSLDNITISLSGFGGNSYYIKNCGLYKVNDGIIQEEYENITGVTNDNILSKIVLPSVFCFKEQLSNGNKIGCIDQEYEGFQALPDRSYQLVVGIYYLNNDMTTAYFDNKTLPAELKRSSDALLNYITNNIFKNNGLQIRHSV